jgi:hypothetical protein
MVFFTERDEGGDRKQLCFLYFSLINELKTGLFTDFDSEMVKK